MKMEQNTVHDCGIIKEQGESVNLFVVFLIREAILYMLLNHKFDFMANVWFEVLYCCSDWNNSSQPISKHECKEAHERQLSTSQNYGVPGRPVTKSAVQPQPGLSSSRCSRSYPTILLTLLRPALQNFRRSICARARMWSNARGVENKGRLEEINTPYISQNSYIVDWLTLESWKNKSHSITGSFIKKLCWVPLKWQFLIFYTSKCKLLLSKWMVE